MTIITRYQQNGASQWVEGVVDMRISATYPYKKRIVFRHLSQGMYEVWTGRTSDAPYIATEITMIQCIRASRSHDGKPFMANDQAGLDSDYAARKRLAVAGVAGY